MSSNIKVMFTDTNYQNLNITLPKNFEDYLTGEHDILLATNYSNTKINKSLFMNEEHYNKYITTCNNCFTKCFTSKQFGVNFYTVPVIFIKNLDNKYTSSFRIVLKNFQHSFNADKYINDLDTNVYYTKTENGRIFKDEIQLYSSIKDSYNDLKILFDLEYKILYIIDVILLLRKFKVNFNFIMDLYNLQKAETPEYISKMDQSMLCYYENTKQVDILSTIYKLFDIKILALEEALDDDNSPYLWDSECVYYYALSQKDNSREMIAFNSPKFNRLISLITRIPDTIKKYDSKSIVVKEYPPLCEHFITKFDSKVTRVIPVKGNSIVLDKAINLIKFFYHTNKIKNKYIHTEVCTIGSNGQRISSPLTNLEDFIKTYGSFNNFTNEENSNGKKLLTSVYIIMLDLKHKTKVGIGFDLQVKVVSHLNIERVQFNDINAYNKIFEDINTGQVLNNQIINNGDQIISDDETLNNAPDPED